MTSHFQQRSTWKLTVGNPLVFPLLADILNETEVNLVQVYKNVSLQVDQKGQSSTDISLKLAEISLHDIKSHIEKLNRSLSPQYPSETRHYHKEIALGVTGLLLTMTFVLGCYFRKRMSRICIRHTHVQGTNQSTHPISSPEAIETTCSTAPCTSKNFSETIDLNSHQERGEETHSLPTGTKTIMKEQEEPPGSPDFEIVPEKPIRI